MSDERIKGKPLVELFFNGHSVAKNEKVEKTNGGFTVSSSFEEVMKKVKTTNISIEEGCNITELFFDEDAIEKNK